MSNEIVLAYLVGALIVSVVCLLVRSIIEEGRREELEKRVDKLEGEELGRQLLEARKQ